jgi:hypothetical protein
MWINNTGGVELVRLSYLSSHCLKSDVFVELINISSSATGIVLIRILLFERISIPAMFLY